MPNLHEVNKHRSQRLAREAGYTGPNAVLEYRRDEAERQALQYELDEACFRRSLGMFRAAMREAPPGEPTDLPESMRIVLPILKQAGALAESDVRVSKADIARESGYEVSALSRPLAAAVAQNLLTSRGGPTGGYRLTSHGESFA